MQLPGLLTYLSSCVELLPAFTMDTQIQGESAPRNLH